MVRICRTLTAVRGSHQVPKSAARVLTGGDLKKEVARETRVLRTAESDVAAIDKGSERQVQKRILRAARRRRDGLARSVPRLAAAQGMTSLLQLRSVTDATRGQYARTLDKFKDFEKNH